MIETKNSNTTNQSTVAAFAILEEMAQYSEPARVTDIAHALGMPRTRVFRYLQTLLQMGYVRQDPATDRYGLTLKLFHLGQAIADGTQLTSVARPVMARLRDTVGQTVTLSIPEDDGMRVIDIVRVETPVQIVTKPGAVLSLHASAQGKVALAWGNPKYRARIEAAFAAQDAELQGRDTKWLDSEIAHARTTGWAVAPEETLPGVNAIAAPIFDIEGRMIATITIVASVMHLTPEPAAHFITQVLQAAREISTDLGLLEYPV
jgi:DNA-binding IclR family transcriptional regulator